MPCPVARGQEHIGFPSSLCVVSNFKGILSPSQPFPIQAAARQLQGAGTAQKQQSTDSYPEVRSSEVLEKHSSQETRHQGCQGNLKY